MTPDRERHEGLEFAGTQAQFLNDVLEVKPLQLRAIRLTSQFGERGVPADLSRADHGGKVRLALVDSELAWQDVALEEPGVDRFVVFAAVVLPSQDRKSTRLNSS